jgi:hypothetical protein
MIVEFLVLVLLGWIAILTYKLVRYENDMRVYQARMLQLMARTNMLKREGRPMPKKEAIKIADELYDIVEGNDDEA